MLRYIILSLFILLCVASQAQTSTTYSRSFDYGPADADSTAYATRNLWWYDIGCGCYRFSENGVKYSLRSYILANTGGTGYWPLIGDGTLSGNTFIFPDVNGTYDVMIGSNSDGDKKFRALSLNAAEVVSVYSANSLALQADNTFSISGVTSSSFDVYAGNLYLNVSDSIRLNSPFGASYNSYTSGHNASNPFWLTNKSYVDSLVSAGGGGAFWPLAGSAETTGGVYIFPDVHNTRTIGIGLNLVGDKKIQNLALHATDVLDIFSEAYVGIQADNNFALNGQNSSIIAVSTGTLELQSGDDNILIAAPNGASYSTDNSAANSSNPRWLTDKGYVDAAIAGGGGGITNSATTNELMKSDGTNAVPSGLSSSTAGNLAMGLAGTAGSTRSLDLVGSSSNIGFQLLTKGTGGISLFSQTSGDILLGANTTGLIKTLLSTTTTNDVKTHFVIDRDVTSGTGANGIGTGIAFRTENGSSAQVIGATIEAVALDVTNGTEDYDLVFKTRASGVAASEKLRVTSTGIGGDSGGLKHGRITTGSVAASTTINVTYTWTTAFTDTNYTVNPSVVEANGELEVVGIISTSTTAVVVAVKNTNVSTARTGTLHLIAMHD